MKTNEIPIIKNTKDSKIPNISYTDRCVCCGRYTVEGEMVCPICKKEVELFN